MPNEESHTQDVHWSVGALRARQALRLCLVTAMAGLLIGTGILVGRSVQKSIERGRASSCCSNLKQLSSALIQYTDDYDRKLPLVSSTPSTSLPPFGWAQPYLRSGEVLHCPSDTADQQTSYALNAGLFTLEVAPGVLASVKRMGIGEPIDLPTIVEAGTPNDGLLDPVHEQPVTRHGEQGSYIAFMDGLVMSSTHTCMYSHPGKHMWEPKSRTKGANP